MSRTRVLSCRQGLLVPKFTFGISDFAIPAKHSKSGVNLLFIGLLPACTAPIHFPSGQVDSPHDESYSKRQTSQRQGRLPDEVELPKIRVVVRKRPLNSKVHHFLLPFHTKQQGRTHRHPTPEVHLQAPDQSADKDPGELHSHYTLSLPRVPRCICRPSWTLNRTSKRPEHRVSQTRGVARRNQKGGRMMQ